MIPNKVSYAAMIKTGFGDGLLYTASHLTNLKAILSFSAAGYRCSYALARAQRNFVMKPVSLQYA